MDYKKEIERLQKIEREQRKIIEKQTGEKTHVVTFNENDEIKVDLSDDKQRKLWQE